MLTNQSAVLENNFRKDHQQLPHTNMQLLTRKVMCNLASRSIFQSGDKIVSSAAGATGAKLYDSSSSRNYVTQARSKQKLLRFPVFPLNETITKFIKTTEPHLTKAELQKTVAESEKFLKEEGAQLQRLLEKQAARDDNWLANRWLRTAYLQYRDPVTIFSSPGMTFPHQKFDTDDDFLRYSSKIIFGMIKYKEVIDKGLIPVVKMGQFELDNSQFDRVFGTCRVPGIKEDTLEFHPHSKHVTVIYKNHFYKMPIYSWASKPLHPDVLFAELKKIVQSEKIKGPDFGILTSDNRDNWATAYSELMSIPGNQQNVRTIQKSLFTVSLDEDVPIEYGKNDLNVLAEQLIHGGGSRQNTSNRWFDKTIQVIVNRNGVNGFCYEHSPAEGQPIAVMTDYVLKNLDNKDLLYGTALGDFEPIQKLELKSSLALNKQMDVAKENIDKLANDLHMNVLNYNGYGKGFLKMQRLSPDSFIQMAIQYAFFKMHKVPGAGYETAHLRIYANGRTETIRSCSNESIEFVRAMLEPEYTDKQRVELLRKAVNGHREYTNMALQGRGVDRHLLGLKLMALENELPIPEFFNTPGFLKSSHFRLSTSQVASVNKAFMCYGPLTKDGYACCYNPRENDMILSVGSWRHNEETCSQRFSLALVDAFDNMMQLLMRVGNKPSSKY